jgi:hypothetical protein
MTDEEHHRLVYLNEDRVSYGYFCGEPEPYEADNETMACDKKHSRNSLS